MNPTRPATVRAFPDLTGYAPAAEAWHAYDTESYDGAEDSSTRNHIGYGSCAAEAITDLERLLDEAGPAPGIAAANDPEEQADLWRRSFDYGDEGP